MAFDQHLAEVLAVPGLDAAQRFERADVDGSEPRLSRFLAL
jgi:hypothetical protein